MKQKILEKDITKAIRDYLNAKGIFHKKIWQGLGSAKGVSDIIGIMPDGRFLAIEVKTEKGKLSNYQKDFLEMIKRNKGHAILARNVDDVIRVIEIKR